MRKNGRILEISNWSTSPTTVQASNDQYFHTSVRLSQNFKIKLQSLPAGTVRSLAEWIIDDSCLVGFLDFKRDISCKIAKTNIWLCQYNFYEYIMNVMDHRTYHGLDFSTFVETNVTVGVRIEQSDHEWSPHTYRRIDASLFDQFDWKIRNVKTLKIQNRCHQWMIHSARPTVPLFSLEYWFIFCEILKRDRRMYGRTTGVKIVITNGRDFIQLSGSIT